MPGRPVFQRVVSEIICASAEVYDSRGGWKLQEVEGLALLLQRVKYRITLKFGSLAVLMKSVI